jgi:hypothetical protein
VISTLKQRGESNIARLTENLTSPAGLYTNDQNSIVMVSDSDAAGRGEKRAKGKEKSAPTCHFPHYPVQTHPGIARSGDRIRELQEIKRHAQRWKQNKEA